MGNEVIMGYAGEKNRRNGGNCWRKEVGVGWGLEKKI